MTPLRAIFYFKNDINQRIILYKVILQKPLFECHLVSSQFLLFCSSVVNTPFQVNLVHRLFLRFRVSYPRSFRFQAMNRLTSFWIILGLILFQVIFLNLLLDALLYRVKFYCSVHRQKLLRSGESRSQFLSSHNFPFDGFFSRIAPLPGCESIDATLNIFWNNTIPYF